MFPTEKIQNIDTDTGLPGRRPGGAASALRTVFQAPAVIAVFLLVALCPHAAFAQVVRLTDSAGTPVTTYYFSAPNDVIYVSVLGGPAGSGTINATVYVEIPPSTRVDQEVVTLNENPAGSGNYFGPASGLSIAFSTPTSFSGTAEGKVGDTVVADYNAQLISANLDKHPVSSSLSLVDSGGTDKTFYYIGTEQVYVRVTDSDEDRDPAAADTISVSLSTSNGDSETLTLTETGNSTGIFEGSISSADASVATGDGTLQASSGSQLTATYTDPDGGGDSSSDTANFIGNTSSSTRFTDGAGTDQASYRIGSDGIFITVADADQNTDFSSQQSFTVTLSDGITGDTETVTLVETTNNSGVFRNVGPGIQSAIGTAASDGVLQTADGSIIQASYTDPDDGTDSSSDTAVTTVTPSASQTRFTDSSGNDVGWYTIGTDGIYVTVDDPDENKDTGQQTISVTVSSSTGDSETLSLTETGGNTGVFRSTSALPMAKTTPGVPGNGTLEVWPLETIIATYSDADGGDSSSDTASTRYFTASSVSITDAAGTEPSPDTFTIGAGDIYVTVQDDDENVDASVPDTLVATLTVSTTGDTETVVLTETGNDTGVFRNTTGLASSIAAANSGNGAVECTENTTLNVAYTDDDDSGDTASDSTTLVAAQQASAVDFTDAAATPVTSYEIGTDQVFVNLTDPDENGDAQSAETVQVTIQSFATGDVETVTLTETGNDTGVFFSSAGLNMAITTRSDNDGTLAVGDGSIIQVQYTDDDDTSDTATNAANVHVAQTSSSCRCTDSTGTSVVFLQIGDSLYVTVDDQDENTVASTSQTVIVTVRNDDNFDTETLTLTETGPNTGIFRNTVGLVTSLESGSVTTGDGNLEGTDGDGITVTYQDNDDSSDISFGTCTLQYLTNATIRFTDASGGALVTDYDIGYIADGVDPIYIEVTDPDENHDPLVQETLYVNLSDLRTGGDTFTWANFPGRPATGNPVELTETTSSSGIFRSTTGLESEIASVDVTDGVLQTIDGATIQAVYTDPDDPSDTRQSNTAVMHIVQQGSVNYFADNFGFSTGSFPIATSDAADMVYLVVEDDDENTNADLVESVTVTVTSTATGDSDQFVLTEIDPNTFSTTGTQVASSDSGYFVYGPIQSNTNYRQLNDGVLETAHDTGIRMHYQDDDDTADFGDDWATMTPPEDSPATILFTDSSGTAVTTYVIDFDLVYVTVTDPDENKNGSVRDSVVVTLYSDIGDVIAALPCRETTSASGIFRNETGSTLQFSATTSPDNILQTDDGTDNIHADYEDPDTGVVVSADASAVKTPTASIVRFTDSSGATRSTFTIGSNDIYITVWDDDENEDSAVVESVDVTVESTYTGDLEVVTLTETGANTGRFMNTVPLNSTIDVPAADGVLQCSAGETVVVTYTDPNDAFDVSNHAAVMQAFQTPATSLEFVDSSPGGSVTTDYLIDTDLVYIRLVDTDRNRSAVSTDTVDIFLTDPVNGDSMTVTLYEVGQNSNTFENWTTGISSLVDPPNTSDQVLQTFHGAVIYADYVDPDNSGDSLQTTATMFVNEDSSAIAFTDQAGTTVTSYWIDPLRPPSLGNGSLIYVTVYDQDENLNASTQESLVCTITDGVTGDFVQNVVLTETGNDTGVFRNVSGIDSEIAVPVTSDTVLQTADLSTITVEYTDSEDSGDYTSTTAVMHVRREGSITQFTDSGGASVTSYLIGADLIYVTVRDADQNADATTVETIAVDIQTSISGDYESIVLTEISSDSDTFRNTAGLASAVDVATASDGLLQTVDGDTVTVTYQDPADSGDISTDTATMNVVPSNSTVEFIVTTGPPPATPDTTHTIRVDPILVEVHDPDENRDPSAIDSVQVTITSPDSTDQETLICYETGVNSGYFQTPTTAAIYSDIAPPVQYDGTFQTKYPSTLVVTYTDAYTFNGHNYVDTSTDSIPTEMFTSPSSIWFSDVNGTAVANFSIYDDPVYITLDDPDQDTDWSSAQTVICTINDPVTTDLVTVTLYETSDNSGVFRNFINGVPSVVSMAVTSNTTLETGDGNTVRVAYQDPVTPTEIATDEATMVLQQTTATVRFTDYFSNTAAYYMIGWDNVYVEVSDRDENRDGSVRETLVVTVYDNDVGDYESLVCTETTSSSGVFRSTSLPAQVAADIPEDGMLQTHDRADILARYVDSDDATDEATSTARMFVASANSSISFLNLSFASGYYFGSDEIVVQVVDPDENVHPLTEESVTVTLTCTESGDSETLLLREDGGTGTDSSVFYNPVGLATTIRSTGTPGNNLFEAPHGAVILAEYSDKDNPPTTPPLDYSWTTCEARIPATTATVAFTDSLGSTVVQLLAGRSNIYVTVTDPDQNHDPYTQDSVSVTIRTSAPLYDQLTVTLTEIGLDAGIFRNLTAVQSEIATSAVTSDSVLQVREEVAGNGIDNIEVTYIDPDDGSDQATDDVDVTYRTDSVVAFTDSSGTTVTTYVIGVDDIYVTLYDEDENADTSAVDTVVVTVTADYNGDTEYLTLYETGNDTGVFRNAARLASTYEMTPTSGDGVMQTIAASTPPPLYTLTVDYVDDDDASDSSSSTADVTPQDPNDRDGDGMPNSYEDSMFGGDAADDPTNAGQDFDGDGRINILEYQQGTDPTLYADNGPTANPGPTQVLDPSLVRLDGSASTDPSTHPPSGIVSYRWFVESAPASVSFDNANSPTPTFIARTEGDYEFRLEVTDADSVTAEGYTTVTINDVAPRAEVIAGAAVDYSAGGTFQLEGRGSSDANRQTLTYNWVGPFAVSPAGSATPSFTLPAWPGAYDFTLTVNDPAPNFSGPAVSTITVHNPAIANGHVPTADAGTDQSVTAGSTVTLDGSLSTDYDEPAGMTSATYSWTRTAMPAGSSAPALLTGVNPTFTADLVGVYVYELRVVNGGMISAPDEVTVVAGSPVNHIPNADAGDDAFGSVLNTFTLDGSGSSDPDGQALTYNWTQVRGESTPLSSTTTDRPTFTPISPGVYEWELTVSDGFNTSRPDRVRVVINDTSGGDNVPVANAGSDQIVLLGSNPSVTFQLDGSNSYDADSDPLYYYWRQVRGTGSSLDDYRSATPRMTAVMPGTYEFELVVYDGSHFSAPDRVLVQVAGNNMFPVADAGVDRTWNISPSTGTVTVSLDGSGSYDPDNAPSPLTYTWTQLSGPSVTLSDPTAVTPSFTASTAGDYVFRLRVYDGELYDEDDVTMHVALTGDTRPTAVAGPDQSNVFIDTIVYLDGSGSFDADGDGFTYLWEQVAGPYSVVISPNPYQAQVNFVPRVKGIYTFRLTVKGDDGQSTDDVNVYVVGGQAGDGGGIGGVDLGGTGSDGGGGGGGCTMNAQAPGDPFLAAWTVAPFLLLLLLRYRRLRVR